MRRAALVLATTIATMGGASAQAQLPDPNFAGDVLGARPCALDVSDAYEQRLYELEGWDGPEYERYPGACRRLRFSYGPIVVKPGQNDVLVGPVTIEKPLQNGYVTRFKPNLVRADGTVPPVEQVHLHHGTWLAFPDYGSGPFFAAGEEKTIAPFPRGYGMPVRATDAWALLYMVHSAVPTPMEVFITYEIDFVPEAAAKRIGMRDAYPVWLDVRPSAYPVFNVQRSFGGADGRCTWPLEQCADFDPFGKRIVGQGRAGNGEGRDLVVPRAGSTWGRMRNFQGGTLIGIGGHLHPGGLTNDIELVRPGGATVKVRDRRRVQVRRTRCVERRGRRCVRRRARTRTVTRTRWVDKVTDRARIYTGRAWYWDREDKSRPGGPPTSWDFSMEVQGLPRWGVRIKPGDRLRSNATYDTTHQATYENMGIAVAILAPHEPDGTPTAPGVDPFETPWTAPDGPWVEGDDCGPDKGSLCETGAVTHGHYAENGNAGGPSGTWAGKPGAPTSNVAIANFLYAPGDLSTLSMAGVPQVKLGTELRFTNVEGAAIYHTITTCAFPCLGQTGAAFPLADGRTSAGRELDLDSSELGIGLPAVGAASQTLTWELPVTRRAGFQPGETVTYFCRVHPFMRGAFEVTE